MLHASGFPALHSKGFASWTQRIIVSTSEDMTAFDDLQLPEEHHEGVETRTEEYSTNCFSSPSCDSIMSENVRLRTCRFCCNKDSNRCVEEKETMNCDSSVSTVCCHHALNSEKLPYIFMSKHEVLCFLNHELDKERIAAESAANEAVSMILRLQIEKAAVQMEARHCQEVLEARVLYNEETISHLKNVISNQQEDRLLLEKEIYQCKQALQLFSQFMKTDDGQSDVSGVEENLKTFHIAVTDLRSMQQHLEDLLMPQDAEIRCRSLYLQEELSCSDAHSMDDMEQIDLSASGFKDEAKTKHVVSISSNESLSNVSLKDVSLVPDSVIHDTGPGKVGDQFHGFEFEEATEIVSRDNFLDKAVGKSWSDILTRLSILQRQLWNLGAHHTSVQCRNSVLNLNDALPADAGKGLSRTTCIQNGFDIEKYRRSECLSAERLEYKEGNVPMVSDASLDRSGLENVSKDNGMPCTCKRCLNRFQISCEISNAGNKSWSEMMSAINRHLLSLEEKFSTYCSMLHKIEIKRKALIEATKLISQNRKHSTKVLSKATVLLKDFLSFTSSGCEILVILHKWVSDSS
ncbi:hypothetical protein KP509_33G059600 [Ceratopteris richardii]|uniref:GTD-binding domain-containing protein n=1 Tax=Ceratopteris richardii TaxID=49495 RepID=A0A8T2QRC8_CERRI|nr:hypothetical protein KP509_33G059600 [Ceratopteris richardii]